MRGNARLIADTTRRAAAAGTEEVACRPRKERVPLLSRHSNPCLPTLVVAVALALPAAGDDWERHTGALRAAVGALTKSHGGDYPGGAGFQARLEALPRGDAAALDALRREALLAHPLLRRHPLLFVVRRQFAPDHHNTETFFQTGEINTGSYRGGGALKTLDVATGRTRTLLDAGPDGLIRDPEVSHDGTRIVFAWRQGRDAASHIFEIGADGTGLRQLTACREANDIDPVYLPDGGIAFTSTRDPKYCMCNRHIMGNLFRMNADGSNILQLGNSTLHEGHPTVLPDGRLLYDRWEYIDRNFGDAQALWTVNPDGTNHAIYWGSNLSSPGGVIDARAVPGTGDCLTVFAACHDRPWGALARIDRSRGVDHPAAVKRTWPESAQALLGKGGWDSTLRLPLKYEDPYPLCGNFHLAVRQMPGRGEETAIMLLDEFGNEVVVHHEAPGCFDPMPLGPRPMPPAIPARRDLARSAGSFYVTDMRVGTHLQGVAPDEVKYLRVVESPEKRSFTAPAWGGQGAQAPAMNWHSFENKRILGTVPVEPDGSAYVAVPANRYIYFQALDANKRMVQSMRSGTIVQAGETQGCVGCHDSREDGAMARGDTLALRRGPSQLDGWFGPPREFSFLTEVQPVFDRHCVGCHDFGTEGGAKLLLARDRELVFNVAYTELWSKGYLRCVGGGPAEIQPAKSWGSHASKLPAYLRPSHHEVALSPEEIERVETWIDLNAPYYPHYETGQPDGVAGRAPLALAETRRLRELSGIDLEHTADHQRHRVWLSFDRPELSPLLSKVAPGDQRDEALAIIRAGGRRLRDAPRGDTAELAMSPADQARHERAAGLARRAAAFLAAEREGRKLRDEDIP
jgi:hypothetical protein